MLAFKGFLPICREFLVLQSEWLAINFYDNMNYDYRRLIKIVKMSFKLLGTTK